MTVQQPQMITLLLQLPNGQTIPIQVPASTSIEQPTVQPQPIQTTPSPMHQTQAIHTLPNMLMMNKGTVEIQPQLQTPLTQPAPQPGTISQPRTLTIVQGNHTSPLRDALTHSVNSGSSLVGNSGSNFVLNTGSNLVGNSGSNFMVNSGNNFVVNSGSSLVGNSGSNFVVNTGTNLVGNSGSNFVVTTGSNLVGNSGSNFVVTTGSNLVGNSGSNFVVNSGSQSYTKQRLKAALRQQTTPSQLLQSPVVTPVKQEQVMADILSSSNVSSSDEQTQQLLYVKAVYDKPC